MKECIYEILGSSLKDIPIAFAISEVVDGSVICRHINSEYEKLTGFSPDDIVDKQWTDLKLFSQKTLDEMSDLYRRSGGFKKYEAWFNCKEDYSIRVKITSQMVNNSFGEYNISTMEDVTLVREYEQQLKKSMDQYQTLIDNAPFGVFVIQDEICAFVNDTGLRILGELNSDDVVGRSTLDFLPDEYIEWAQEVLKDDVVGKVHEPKVIQIRNDAGELHWVEDTTINIEFNGKPAHLVMLQDIHKRKTGELLIQRQNEELEQNNIALERKQIALSEMVDNLNVEKKRLNENISKNIDVNVLPLMEKLRQNASLDQQKLIRVLGDSIITMTDSFGVKINKELTALTIKEVEVANMIRQGYATKEISDMVCMSFRTVESYRKNIRKKLGLQHTSQNLATYLRNIIDD